MVKSCFVKSCRSESTGGCGISFHRFPTNKEIFKKWLQVVPGRVSASSVVCGLHFKADDFATHSVAFRKLLKPDAVPSIFPKKTKMAAKVYKCKCCLERGNFKNLWQEYKDDEMRDEYGNMLIECFALPWSRPENPKSNPELICKSCIGRLKDAVIFKAQVLASAQMLAEHIEAENLAKSNQENDDSDDDVDVQYDVKTEYLDYEYLEDVDNDEDSPDDSDGGRDDSDDFLENACDDDDDCDVKNQFNETGVEIKIEDAKDDMWFTLVKDPDYRENQAIAVHLKRTLSEDTYKNTAVDAMVEGGNSQAVAANRFKKFKKDVTNDMTIKQESCDTQTVVKKEKRITQETEEYLQDVLRYSNATPIRRHTTNGYQCCFCKDQYDSPKDLKHHTLDKHASNLTVDTTQDYIKLDITNLKCLDCYANLDCLRDFTRHMKTEHKMQLRKGAYHQIVPFKFDADVIQCVLCEKMFNTFNCLNRHMKFHFDINESVDESLKRKEKIAKTDEYEENYIKIEKHNNCLDFSETVPQKQRKIILEDNEDEKSKFKFTCSSCGWSFENRTALLVHMNVYHLKLPVKCQYCDSKFIKMKDLSRHVTVKHSTISR